MTTERTYVMTGVATREGSAEPSADAAAVHILADGTTAAAVVDGIGHSTRIAAVAQLVADVAVRMSARRGGLAGMLTATELVADPGAGEEPEPDAVAVVAVTEPGDDRIRIAWVGDCRAYSLTPDKRLQPCTVDHNLAEQLEMCGYAGEVTSRASQWVRTTVATAAVATVAEAWTDAPLVVLTSDGVHDQAPHDVLEALVLQHQHDPQALAEALVAASEANPEGVRDDATAVVIRHA
ncbi:SpoIIE family protein phosphatase [Streptomyces antimycoticus]|uniref:SpoIIE family protein phosphatase n=1 Tax=Streptomyces antimycoticus TaxID=68175 RepID=UPI00386F7D3B|nr:SpoIIE family protein phosphatase [Streptomyces antimycoticus]